MLFGKGIQSDTKPLVDIFSDVLSHKFGLRSAYASVVGQVRVYQLMQLFCIKINQDDIGTWPPAEI